jgi:hypothetical protein
MKWVNYIGACMCILWVIGELPYFLFMIVSFLTGKVEGSHGLMEYVGSGLLSSAYFAAPIVAAIQMLRSTGNKKAVRFLIAVLGALLGGSIAFVLKFTIGDRLATPEATANIYVGFIIPLVFGAALGFILGLCYKNIYILSKSLCKRFVGQ